MSLRRARSVNEYVEWGRQVVFEVGDLRNCLEDEREDMSGYPAFLGPLEAGINSVYDAMKEGSYVFGREDLPFMDFAAKYPQENPFNTPPQQVNETLRRG